MYSQKVAIIAVILAYGFVGLFTMCFPLILPTIR